MYSELSKFRIKPIGIKTRMTACELLGTPLLQKECKRSVEFINY